MGKSENAFLSEPKCDSEVQEYISEGRKIVMPVWQSIEKQPDVKY